MMSGDNLDSALSESQAWLDDRVEHSWDPERRLGEVFAKRLGLRGVAWDVYLVYPAGIVWADEVPPEPAFWMHQLPTAAGADEACVLNPESLYRAVIDVLGPDASPRREDLRLRLHLKGLRTLRRDRTL